jgi:hypothetical protein
MSTTTAAKTPPPPTPWPTCGFCDFQCGYDYNQPRDACVLMLIGVVVAGLILLVLLTYLISRYCCVQRAPTLKQRIERYGMKPVPGYVGMESY